MEDKTRKLATIQRIESLVKHPNADHLDIVTIKGWKVVTKTNEFKVGDLCVYCEIDSLMPERPEFEFLRSRNFRIRTIKLRNQISQGICFPLTIFNSIGELQHTWTSEYLVLLNNGDKIHLTEELDVTDVLKITKYELPIPAQLAGIIKGGFPSHSIKTDEERIQNLIDKYEDFKKEEWIVTEKLDGTSITVYYHNGNFGVCSRNLELKESDTNTYWQVVKDLNLEKKLIQHVEFFRIGSLVLQGELIGENIQGNKYNIKGHTIRWFRAYNPKLGQFYPFIKFIGIMETLDIQSVPIIDMNFKLPDKYEDLIAYANGPSKLYQGLREGIVLVAKNPLYSDNGRLSFKVVSNNFLIKYDE